MPLEEITSAHPIEMKRSDFVYRHGLTHEKNRNIYKEFGYPRTITFQDYQEHYERQDIADAVISKPPEDTWKESPLIIPVGEDQTSALTQAIEQIASRTGLWSKLERADRISGIGCFGVLLIGYADGRPLRFPVGSVSGKAYGLLYLKPYSQGNVKIKSQVIDPADPRFGLPEIYQIKFGDTEGKSNVLKWTDVHYSRIIHIAENLNEDEIYGKPRLKAIFNRLIDMDKVSGSGAEGFWEMATRWVLFNIDMESSDTMSDADKDEMKEALEKLRNNYEKYLRTQGVDIKTLDPVEIQPEETFNMILSLISAGTGIPKRILIGSERGELASSQDQANWFGKIETRRTKFAEPVILRPLIDSLMDHGVLEKTPYEVEWPNLFELNALEEAEKTLKYSESISKLSPDPIADGIVSPAEIRGKILMALDLPDEEIEQTEVERELEQEGVGAKEWDALHGKLVDAKAKRSDGTGGKNKIIRAMKRLVGART
jgi:hypothetical protein